MTDIHRDLAIASIKAAIAELTYEYIERWDMGPGGTSVKNEELPLLDRSIGNDLLHIDKTLGTKGGILTATADSINAALLAMTEALIELDK